MFITELENIYNKKPILNELIDSKNLIPYIRQFLVEEVRLGGRYLNPYRFAYKFGYSPKVVIQLFIAFSQKDGPLNRIYKYTCCNCGELNLMDDEGLANFCCTNCEDRGQIDDVNFLEDVSVVFEIKENYFYDVVDYLKAIASSEVTPGEDKKWSGNDSVSLKQILTISNEFKQEHNVALDENLEKQAKAFLRSGLYR